MIQLKVNVKDRGIYSNFLVEKDAKFNNSDEKKSKLKNTET